jgi:hypothetical protein
MAATKPLWRDILVSKQSALVTLRNVGGSFCLIAEPIFILRVCLEICRGANLIPMLGDIFIEQRQEIVRIAEESLIERVQLSPNCSWQCALLLSASLIIAPG